MDNSPTPTRSSTTHTKIKQFPFQLDQAEKLDRGQQLAAGVQRIYDARDLQKDTTKQLKDAVLAAEKAVGTLREVVATGVEWRDVECEERFYHSSGEVVTIRMDTGESVGVRPMTMDERQHVLPLGDED